MRHTSDAQDSETAHAEKTEPDNMTKKIEQTETGYQMRIESTRGTGTRDQDTVKLTLRQDTLAGIVSELAGADEAVSETMNRRRSHQPDQENLGDD